MHQQRPDDLGFSLTETLVSIAIIGVVMTALATFFVATTKTLDKQRSLQVAVRFAHDGVELVKSLPGSSVVAGRSLKDVTAQFTDDTVTGLDLSEVRKTMLPAADGALGALASSVNPALPVVPELLKVNDTTFERHWFVGSCTIMLDVTKSSECVLPSTAPGALPFYRVIVAVTFQDSRACSGGECSYITQTLVSAAPTDPIFNPSMTVVPPLPEHLVDQVSEVTVPIAPLTLTATTANPPITWSPDQLPPGLVLSGAGVLSGTPTVPGTYHVLITVRDASSVNYDSFTWTVNPLPSITGLPDQAWDAGSAVSYPVPLAGGTGPFKWTANGLPLGLTISPTTGVITGSSTVSGPAAVSLVTVTVVDNFSRSATASFTWRVKLAVQYPRTTTPIALTEGQPLITPVGAAGGSGAYSWPSPDLPPGLSLTAGVLGGTVTATTRYLVTLNVTDSLGATNSMLVPINVQPLEGRLRVTNPAAASADRTDPKGRSISWKATASNGTGHATQPYTWVATNLPPGITLNRNNDRIESTPTAVGNYLVRLVVTDRNNAASTFMFVWTIS